MLRQKATKRVLALLLAAVMLLSTVACGGNESGDKTTTPAAETTAPAEDTTAPVEDTTVDPDLHVEDEKNVVLYVSPDGNDETGDPYATLEAAKLAVRAMDKTNLESITVCFKEGHYESYATTFTEEDSGTETCRIIYTSYGDDEVIIGAEKVIPTSAFHAVEGEAMLARLSDDAKANVLCASLTEIGMTVEECRAFRDANHNANRASIFVNGVRQTIARYPDTEYLRGGGLKKMEDGSARRFKVSSDEDMARFSSWENNGDIWLFGFWKYDWADSYHCLETVDTENKMIIMESAHGYGYARGCHHYYLNIFEELTVPGEYYIDWENGMVYYYPEENFEQATVAISMSQDDILCMNNTSYLTFRNIILEGSQHEAVSGKMNHVTFDTCIIRNVAYYGMWLTGNDLKFLNCEYAGLGGSGMDINGGDRESLTSSEIVIDNCYFHDYGQIEHISYGLWIRGVNVVVSHNEFCNCPHGGIYFYGNDHLMEYNEFYNLQYECDDASVIYSGRHFDYYGNMIRYNYFHDIYCPYTWGGTNYYSPKFIYEDDGLCGTTVIGNLFVGGEICYSNIKIGGMDCVTENNIFVKCGGINFAGCGYLYRDSDSENDTFLRESPFMTEVWIEHYPQMNKFRHGAMTEYPTTAEELGIVLRNNLIFVKPENYDPENEDIEFGTPDCAIVENNKYVSQDDLSKYFVDPDNRDFTMKEDAPCMAFEGFEALPFAEMGRYDV